MATILFAWELGGGMGHISQLVPLARGLQSVGHRIVVALREVPRAAGLLDNSGITLLQSPYKPPAGPASIATPRTFAHVLWNAGFGERAELQVLTEAWGNLLDFSRPGPDRRRSCAHGLTCIAWAKSETGCDRQRILLSAGLLAAAGLAAVDAATTGAVARGGAVCIGLHE